MAATKISTVPVTHDVTIENFEVPYLNVEKAIKALYDYIEELEEAEPTQHPRIGEKGEHLP